MGAEEEKGCLLSECVWQISKSDEDHNYDTFVDSLMAQLRQLPPLPITEPLLSHNYAVCMPYGAGDPAKISIR